MQVFVPYINIIKIVKEMACDKRRFNKQIVESSQIIKAIKGETEAWKNHPICWQYKRNVEWLEWYKLVFELFRNNDYKFNKKQIEELNNIQPKIPPFLYNEEYLNSHKRRLYQKSPNLYPQFEIFNDESDKSNWYFVPEDFNIPKRKGVDLVGIDLFDEENKIMYYCLRYSSK